MSESNNLNTQHFRKGPQTNLISVCSSPVNFRCILFLQHDKGTLIWCGFLHLDHFGVNSGFHLRIPRAAGLLYFLLKSELAQVLTADQWAM